MKTQHVTHTLAALSIAMSGACMSPGASQGGRLGEHGLIPSAQTLQATSHILAFQGRDSECEIVLKKLIKDHPRAMSSYNELAELYLRNDRVEGAMAALTEGLEVEPEEAVLMNNMGMCHILLKDYAAALEWFELAAAADANDARSTANIGFALGMLGRYEEALASYLTVMSRADAHHNLGVLYDATGDHEAAEAAFEYARILRESGA